MATVLCESCKVNGPDPRGPSNCYSCRELLRLVEAREEWSCEIACATMKTCLHPSDSRCKLTKPSPNDPNLAANREAVNHPSHYGGDTVYETIKVIAAWQLGFLLGNAVKYISRAGKKNRAKLIEDLEKGRWYLDKAIERLKAGAELF